MDIVKIGKYIARRRKILGLTQKQVAERLGMSDKSVSKWERGICMPDVSVYTQLCDILGISINEFIAGEDISEENIIKKIGGKPEVKQHLENLGFVTGGTVRVVSAIGGNLIVNVKESRVAINKEMASKIMI